jgi:hypothetical protein
MSATPQPTARFAEPADEDGPQGSHPLLVAGGCVLSAVGLLAFVLLMHHRRSTPAQPWPEATLSTSASLFQGARAALGSPAKRADSECELLSAQERQLPGTTAGTAGGYSCMPPGAPN